MATYASTRDGQHISCTSSTGRCLIIIRPISRTSCWVISIFSYISRNSCPVSVSVFRMSERRRWMSHSTVVPIQAADFYDTQGDQMLKCNWRTRWWKKEYIFLRRRTTDNSSKLPCNNIVLYARRVGSDGSMSASGSAGPGSIPRRGSIFSFENFQPRG